MKKTNEGLDKITKDGGEEKNVFLWWGIQKNLELLRIHKKWRSLVTNWCFFGNWMKEWLNIQTWELDFSHTRGTWNLFNGVYQSFIEMVFFKIQTQNWCIFSYQKIIIKINNSHSLQIVYLIHQNLSASTVQQIIYSTHQKYMNSLQSSAILQRLIHSLSMQSAALGIFSRSNLPQINTSFISSIQPISE